MHNAHICMYVPSIFFVLVFDSGSHTYVFHLAICMYVCMYVQTQCQRHEQKLHSVKKT